MNKDCKMLSIKSATFNYIISVGNDFFSEKFLRMISKILRQFLRDKKVLKVID